MLPLASNTQGVEAQIKDVSIWKSTGKSKQNIINIGSIRSVILNNVTKKMKIDPEYINQKQNKLGVRKEYLPGQYFNTNIL